MPPPNDTYDTKRVGSRRPAQSPMPMASRISRASPAIRSIRTPTTSPRSRPVSRLEEKPRQLGGGVGDPDPGRFQRRNLLGRRARSARNDRSGMRSEEHTSELQ